MKNQDLLKAFLDGFKNKISEVDNSRIESDKLRFDKFFSDWKYKDSELSNDEKKNAVGYNVFSILKNAEKEVTTHSPFLADLLNIRGAHKQQELFYLEFLRQLNVPNEDYFIPKNKFCFYITESKYIGPIDKEYNQGGFIDILINYSDGEKEFAIAIENKINAGDQRKQLIRYYNYLKKTFDKNFLLIYLTPYGDEPSTGTINPTENEVYSITKEPLNQYKKNGELIIASYSKHIKNTLEKTIEQVKAENVRSIINQYLQIILNF